MGEFDDLLKRNQTYAETFQEGGFDGVAHAGVLVLTCMDSRIEPLRMLGLNLGDAKILRTPGGRATPDATVGCILGVHLLNVNRIMVVPHTRCAMASGSDQQIAESILERDGTDIRGMVLGATTDQLSALTHDVRTLRSHPLITGLAEVGGFMFDVDTGLLAEIY